MTSAPYVSPGTFPVGYADIEAAAAAIALVGLSANQCGGGEEQKAPETPPAESPPPAQ